MPGNGRTLGTAPGSLLVTIAPFGVFSPVKQKRITIGDSEMDNLSHQNDVIAKALPALYRRK